MWPVAVPWARRRPRTAPMLDLEVCHSRGRQTVHGACVSSCALANAGPSTAAADPDRLDTDEDEDADEEGSVEDTGAAAAPVVSMVRTGQKEGSSGGLHLPCVTRPYRTIDAFNHVCCERPRPWIIVKVQQTLAFPRAARERGVQHDIFFFPPFLLLCSVRRMCTWDP